MLEHRLFHPTTGAEYKPRPQGTNTVLAAILTCAICMTMRELLSAGILVVAMLLVTESLAATYPERHPDAGEGGYPGQQPSSPSHSAPGYPGGGSGDTETEDPCEKCKTCNTKMKCDLCYADSSAPGCTDCHNYCLPCESCSDASILAMTCSMGCSDDCSSMCTACPSYEECKPCKQCADECDSRCAKCYLFMDNESCDQCQPCAPCKACMPCLPCAPCKVCSDSDFGNETSSDSDVAVDEGSATASISGCVMGSCRMPPLSLVNVLYTLLKDFTAREITQEN